MIQKNISKICVVLPQLVEVVRPTSGGSPTEGGHLPNRGVG